VGVYYNKQKFEEHGWTVPTTWDEFTQLLADIKAAGETPIAFGNLDGWNGIHEFSAVQHVLVDGEYINDFVYGVNDVSFDTPENRQAAEIMQEWVEAGYFTEGFMGIGYDDVTVLFKNGDGVLTITGSWLAGELVDAEFDWCPRSPPASRSSPSAGWASPMPFARPPRTLTWLPSTSTGW